MHYKNGREAKVGDPVVGVTFNIKGILAGTLVSLTPGPDTCSAIVGTTYLELIKGDKFSCNPDVLVKMQGTENHGSGGTWSTVRYRQDYTECKNLLHAEDVWKAMT